MQDDVKHGLQAEYRLLGEAPAGRIDQALLLRVALRNTGSAVWLNQGPHPVNLSYHWRDADGEMVDFEGLRTMLPANLAPGETVELDMVAEPPAAPGSYLLELDLVEEGVSWLSQRDVAPLRVAAEIGAAISDRPRICLISQICLINDAVGNHMLNQVRAFESWGYPVVIVVEHMDNRQPAEMRRHMVRITAEQLDSGEETATNRRAHLFFHSADIFIFHYPVEYPLFEAIRQIERGCVIVDYHGVTPAHLWERSSGPEYERLLASLRQIRLVRYADYAIAHSSYARDELLSYNSIGAERIWVMPYVLNVENFRPAARDAELDAKYGLAGRPVLLYVGRMAGNKRIIDLVRALPLISARHPGTMLLLVGDNTTAPYLPVVHEALDTAAQLGCADQLVFTGPIAHSELQRFYTTCDVYVTSSLHEGFCIPVVEAMACGTPVVGTHTTALPETIGDAGLTFEPQNSDDLARKVIEILDSRAIERLAEPARIPAHGQATA